MAISPSQSIVDQVKALPPDEQLRVAEAIDKFTWAQRWRRVCERIEARVRSTNPMSDDQVDEAVREVRKEKSLSDRSSTPQS
ncbi:MAG TPA: hypothetical protein VJZ71_11530 [Phycisphaerae bacterium]|nr:hypothetical protein [Phycisphaerae bacterium]